MIALNRLTSLCFHENFKIIKIALEVVYKLISITLLASFSASNRATFPSIYVLFYFFTLFLILLLLTIIQQKSWQGNLNLRSILFYKNIFITPLKLKFLRKEEQHKNNYYWDYAKQDLFFKFNQFSTTSCLLRNVDPLFAELIIILINLIGLVSFLQHY